MTPQERGRFCDSCQRCIVDFSRYSDKELYRYLTDNAGKQLCGRFSSLQLNRNILPPPQHHSALYNGIVAVGMALVFTAIPNSPTFAQVPHAQEQTLQGDDKPDCTTISNQVTGTVFDQTDKTIKGAHVAIFSDGISHRTKTNEHGDFSFSGLDSGTYTIESYIKTEDGKMKRGLINGIPVLADKGLFVNVRLSTGEDNYPYIQEYNDMLLKLEETEIVMGIFVNHVESSKSEVTEEIQQVPYRNTEDIILTAPGVQMSR